MPARRILILGGTHEARGIAADLLAKGHSVVTSFAGVTENPVLPPGDTRNGGFGGVAGLQDYLRREAIALVIDATHPFAAQMSRQAHEACVGTGVPLLHFERPAWQAGEGDHWQGVGSAEEAAHALPPAAHVLLTIGRKEVQPFFARADLSGIARMIEEPAAECPPGWTLLRLRPPFTLAAEIELMTRNGLTHLVTKNAGGTETEAKLIAARHLRLPVIMIERPHKPDIPVFASRQALAAAAEEVLSS